MNYELRIMAEVNIICNFLTTIIHYSLFIIQFFNVYKHPSVFVAVEGGDLFLLEFDDAVFGGINGVIIAHSRIQAGMIFSAVLADDDITSDCFGATKNLDAKSLGDGIAS